MSNVFWGQSKDGKLSLVTEHNRARFADFLKKSPNVRIRIEPYTPESKKQRGFFEGAVIPLVTYYQEGLDHTDYDDCRKVRDWLKIEFNGELMNIKGKVVKIAKTTRGDLQRGLLEKILDWMEDQGYQVELLKPSEYKHWKDKIFPFEEGPDNYIDYLVSLNRLTKKI